MNNSTQRDVTPENSILREWTGPLTSDVTLHPGDFGLGKVPAKFKPDATTTMVCGFCSTGCGLNIHLKEGRAVNLTPQTNYPVNLGMACPKGWEALTPLQAHDRATTPYVRNSDGKLEPADWHQAMTLFCERFKDIQSKHGPESIAFLSTGQIVTEEMAFLGTLAKFGMGMIHGDGNTRQCMATAVTAYKESFGFDAPPYTYRDFEESDVLVFVGSNLCIAHPILWQRVLRNPNRPEIIVIDPRKTETAMAATQHYPIRPKSDLTFLYGLANILINRGWIDPDYITRHTLGFENFKKHIQPFTPETVAQNSGIDVNQLHRLAETIHQGKRVSFWWTMGVNQSHEGTRVAQAIINIALMTGNIGRPGTGANSITGQCNAMGSRLFSNTTNLLGGHDFKSANDRNKVATILGMDVGRIPSQTSWAYDQIIEGIDNGSIKGLWIVATNTAHSWINQSSIQKIFAKLEFLVVQDMYHTTETAQLAHLVLPAAAWGEKFGTFINSERRIGLVKKVSPAPGQALSDFNIFKLVAAYWGCADLFTEWQSPEDVFQIIKKLSRGQSCDFSGIVDYQMIDAVGGIQWPLRQEEKLVETERRLFSDGIFYHKDGKARFIFDEPREMLEHPDKEYPFILLTGRGTAAQWHTQTRTAKSAVLRRLYPEAVYVEINPSDAARLGIAMNAWVTVASRRGKLKAKAFITSTIASGQVFIPMHYAQTNQLTFPSFDPHSRQPSYKASAVSIRAIRSKQ
jgi:anaerobic selenocysteine-containing dehydrogenase